MRSRYHKGIVKETPNHEPRDGYAVMASGATASNWTP
jgi:hypothetical protein